MYTLYIDTHFVELVLALFKDEKLIDVKKIASNLHSKYTVNLLNTLLIENAITVQNLNEVFVVNGPGSFTGVRIGVVIAKMIGYNLDIPIKSISYLQGMALNYDEDVIVGIKDKNGAFIGEFNHRHELMKPYYYLSNSELEKFQKNVIYDSLVDLKKLYEFMKKEDAISSHALTPLYVKKIEVGK